ncbi:MAG: radical SAM protein [Alsobacter sp.]
MSALVHRRELRTLLIKPSHYDDEGYVIQWVRSSMPSNSLAALYGLIVDCQAREALGPGVRLTVDALDETNARIEPERLAASAKRDGAMLFVLMVGVQSNQYPRAVDLALRFKAAGAAVAIGGFHVSGSLAMLPGVPPELRAAEEAGITLYAGEAEDGIERLLQDAWNGTLAPRYDHMANLPNLGGVPLPFLPENRITRTLGRLTTFDAGRGCPFQCSFCTIINVQGRVSRRRTADDVEAIVRQNAAQGINSFFITDDNFARNKDWEKIFDRLIALRETHGLSIKLMIQVDTLCHRIPNFIAKAKRAGVNKVFIGLESIDPATLVATKKKQNRIAEYRTMLQGWKSIGCIVYAGYIIGFPSDTPESVDRQIRVIQRELPIDFLEFFILTPLPGSEDHQKLAAAGVPMDEDLNRYDTFHAVTDHPAMSREAWEETYRRAWRTYYTVEHMRTLMRRAAACRISVGKMMTMLIGFWTWSVLEGIHPLEGGYVRRMNRRDRRPGLPLEPVWRFYPRRAARLVRVYAGALALAARLLPLRRALKADPGAAGYVDLALTPLSRDEAGDLELMAAPPAGRPAPAGPERRPAAHV